MEYGTISKLDCEKFSTVLEDSKFDGKLGRKYLKKEEFEEFCNCDLLKMKNNFSFEVFVKILGSSNTSYSKCSRDYRWTKHWK